MSEDHTASSRSKPKSLKKTFVGDVLGEMEPHDVSFFFVPMSPNRGNPQIYSKFHGSLADSHHHGRSTKVHCPQK